MGDDTGAESDREIQDQLERDQEVISEAYDEVGGIEVLLKRALEILEDAENNPDRREEVKQLGRAAFLGLSSTAESLEAWLNEDD